jgi:predicted Fe-S protein YdhL (DUF1289 family)
MMAVTDLAERARAVARGSGGDVPSPCISVCRMDPAGQYCEGCCRTLDEIVVWSQLPAKGKREVWRRIAKRARGREPMAQEKPDPEAP